MTYHSDYDVYGFRRSEILPILEKHGITFESETSAQLSTGLTAAAQVPEWKQVLARRKRLSVYEAVCSMAGVDPFTQADTVERFGVNEAAYDMNKALLDEAIDDGTIPCREKKEGNFTQYFIEADDFARWCDENDIPRPLPWELKSVPVTDGRLIKQLEEANQRVEALEKTIESLRAELRRQEPGQDLAAVLDPSNDLSPIELRAALDAWRAVVADGNPRNRGAGVRNALIKWLKENQKKYGLGKGAVDRIATVANWHKRGGLPKTPIRTPPSLQNVGISKP